MSVSPGSKSGMVLPAASFAICSCSSCLIRFIGLLRRLRRKCRRRTSAWVVWNWACFYDTARALSPVRGGLLGRAGAGQMGGPEVGPALAGEPFGLRPPPSRNFGVIAASEHVGDSAAFEHLGPGILRVFEQARGEAFL